jgi:hypothetical protein
MNIIELKRELIKAVQARLEEKVARQRTAMDDAQKEANSHKGAMASRYDTCKEEAQALRDGHARQLQALAEVVASMQQLQPVPCNQVALGAVVVTKHAQFFVSTGMIDDPVIVEEQEYDCVSVTAPIMLQMRGKSKGATVNTPGGPTTILDIR